MMARQGGAFPHRAARVDAIARLEALRTAQPAFGGITDALRSDAFGLPIAVVLLLDALCYAEGPGDVDIDSAVRFVAAIADDADLSDLPDRFLSFLRDDPQWGVPAAAMTDAGGDDEGAFDRLLRDWLDVHGHRAQVMEGWTEADMLRARAIIEDLWNETRAERERAASDGSVRIDMPGLFLAREPDLAAAYNRAMDVSAASDSKALAAAKAYFIALAEGRTA